MSLALLLLPACIRWQEQPETGDETGVVPDTHDSGEESGPDSDTGGGPTDIPWITQSHVDRDTWADLELEVITYSVTADNPTGYRDQEGNDPLFYVVRPVADRGEERPVLLWLHGSAQGVDDDESRNRNCGTDGIAATVEDALDHPFIAAEIARRDWLWVLPVNTWCDYWTGRGADDPVDTSHHGYEHVQTILDALAQGFDGNLSQPGEVRAWGTSIGGAGVFTNSTAPDGSARFAAIVDDSGPVSPTTWYSLPSQSPYLDHVYGGAPFDENGDPTEFYDNYARADGPTLVNAGTMTTPLFITYNNFDGLVPERQNTTLESALEAMYDPADLRWFIHDFDHHAPGTMFHIQTGYERPPMSYTNRAAFSFLEGRRANFVEAEVTCVGTCTAIAETGTGKLEASSANSGGSGIIHADGDPEGVFYAGELPASLPRGVPVTILPVLSTTGLDASFDDESIVTLELKQDGESLLSFTMTGADFADDSLDASHADLYQQVDATTWDIESAPTGTVTLQAFSHGRGGVVLDGFWYLYE